MEDGALAHPIRHGTQWLAKGAYPSDTPTQACVVQSVFIELGDMVSVLANLLIGVHIAVEPASCEIGLHDPADRSIGQ